jgi:hypothetical protein
MRTFGMNLSKRNSWALLSGLTLVIAGCSSGDSTSAVGTIESSQQNLSIDPNGTTTVVTFSQAPASAAPGYFTADGGQTASSASINGNTVRVVWDSRVSPSDTITVAGLPGIIDGDTTPSTTNSAAPTFTITDSAKNTGLGADTLEVTFSGPRVDEADAEDPTSWDLVTSSTSMDLTGSTFVLDVSTQVLTITLGSSSNLHANFTLAASSLVSVADTSVSTTPLAGTATGDAAAPTLVSVEQNLTADEFGRVVDFTFSEAMSPSFSQSASNFAGSGPNPATSVSQPTAGVLRVTFNAPAIPGSTTITPSNMMDAHGNTMTIGVQAVAQPSPVTNSYTSGDAVTVADTGGDYIEAIFAQAFESTSASNVANWSLDVDGSSVNLALQTFDYDFLTKTLRIDLVDDMTNGVAYTLTPIAVLEVDGETFSTADAGTVGGDVALPTIVSSVQNRTEDPLGMTIDVTMSEDMDETSAEITGSWSVSGLTVAAADVLGSGDIVRLTLTGGAAVPGIATVGVNTMTDIAGNIIASATGLAVTTTDSTEPTILSSDGTAPEGADNDTVAVRFDDYMVEAGVIDPDNWVIESPIGTAMTTTGATVTYNSTTRVGTLTFDAVNDMYFKLGDTFEVTLSNMTDISGNAVSATSDVGSIDFERNHPYAHRANWDSGNTTVVNVRFNEHMDILSDLYSVSNTGGVRYVVRDNVGALRGSPNTATALDEGLGVQLDFGFVVNATDTIDVLGATDLVGNYMYPNLLMPLVATSATEPALGTQSTAPLSVSGERNDVVTIIFDRNLSPWGAENYNNFTINDGTADLDLSTAQFEFDGDDTVVITMNGVVAPSLQGADTYSFTVDNIQTDQGVEMSASDTAAGNTVTGDTATPPTIGASSVRIDRANPDSLLVYSDEALDQTTAEDESRWYYNTSTFPDTAVLVDPTTVRLTFPLNPTAGNNLAYNAMDLAGNESGAGAQAVLAGENVPPALLSVQGTATAGENNDYVTINFNEPVEIASGLDVSNYVLTNGVDTLPLTTTGAWYDSTSFAVNFPLATGYEFDASLGIGITVTNVRDHSSNAMASSASPLAGVVVGDTSTAPDVISAFSNYRENSFGLLVDVLFTEAPEETFITNPFSWSVTGGSSVVVLGVTRIDEDEYRVALSGALVTGAELEIVTAMPDLAGNVTSAVTAVDVSE